MKAIIDELNYGSIIEIPNADRIIIVEVDKIGFCISVKYRNMLTWIELDPLLTALDKEGLDDILGKTIRITEKIAKSYCPVSKDIE